MPKYNTRQRELLIAYLSEHADEKISVPQIEAALKDSKISLSAIYRNLSALEKAGKLKKYIGNSAREVSYQYIDSESCRDSIHLACRICGNYFHMNAEDTAALIQSVREKNGFRIDKTDSVLYGVCENCSK